MSSSIPPFDPAHITGRISMNRVVVADLPGMPDKLRGKTGYGLLSAEALIALIKPHRDALKIPPEVAEADLPRQLDAGLLRGWGDEVMTITTIVSAFACRLSYVLATLKRGDPASREARSEWDNSYWTHWAGIKRVVLGGGLASGILGGVAAQLSEETLLPGLGVHDLRVEQSIFGAKLPLYGAARYAPSECRRAYVLDFGGTSVKRGRAIYGESELLSVEELPSLPAQSLDPAGLFNFMVETMATREIEHDGIILASLATYLEDGHPQNGQGGIYGDLAKTTTNLQAELTAAVSERLGRAVTVRLFHDGSAAATVYAGSPHCAVLMMGTALGIGFPPPTEDGLRRFLYL